MNSREHGGRRVLRKRSAAPRQRAVGPHLWNVQAVRDATWVGFLTVVVAAAVYARGVLLPVLAALLLAYIADPILTHAAKSWRWPRWVTATLIALLATSVVLASFVWLAPIASEQIRTLIQRLPDYVGAVSAHVGLDIGGTDTWLAQVFDSARADPKQALSGVFHTTGTALGFLRRILGAAGKTALMTLVVPILFVGFAWRFPAMLAWTQSLVPRSRRDRALRIARAMDRVVAGFFRGRLLISMIVGVLLAAGWKLAGVPYWAVLGPVTGLLNVIPYVSTVAWPIAVALRYADAVTSGGAIDPVSILVAPSLVFVAVQCVENWILTPWIQSESTNLSVVTVTVVMLVGGATGGVLGLLLAIPLAACAKILMKETLLPRLRRWAEEH